MKKGMKIFWIVCGVMGGIGVVFCTVALILGVSFTEIRAKYPYGISIGNDWGWEDDSASEINEGFQGESTNLGEFKHMKELTVDVTNIDVEIKEHNLNTIKVLFTGHKNSRFKEYIQLYEDEEELVIEMEKNTHNLNTKGQLKIYIPKDYKFNDVSLDIGAGKITVDTINAQELSIVVGAGKVLLKEFKVTDIEIDCGVGEAEATGVFTQSADIDCGVGSVDLTILEQQQEAYNYSIDCGIGIVNVGSESYTGLGSTKKIHNGGSKEIDINCGIGEVDVNFN